MSRLKILLLQFRLNLVQNLFFIAECVLVFLVVNSGISTLLYSGYLERYADFDLDTVFFLSGAVYKLRPVLRGRPRSPCQEQSAGIKQHCRQIRNNKHNGQLRAQHAYSIKITHSASLVYPVEICPFRKQKPIQKHIVHDRC